MVLDAERFLVKCYDQKNTLATFNDLRFEKYHSKAFHFDLEKLPPTSSSIRNHIQWAYFQSYIWLNSPSNRSLNLNPLDF